ncbi:FapA family protein [Geobacillus sp. 46C-IIa]|uniref:flagellar assembly protein A n=1 Tax=Geobacillus sp. 46C-IIa TaxID=1963025 RepID=UPI001E2B55E8|nr:FapA family protein [Geobacillus sp. 46C-IIa]
MAILQGKREEVHVEIIQKETRKIWIIGSKPAIVKLTKIERQTESSGAVKEEKFSVTNANVEQIKATEDHLSGKAWVRGGKIFYRSSPLCYPTITVGQGVLLLKNGHPVTGTTVVTEGDQLEIQTIEETVETKWDIVLDEDKLHAILHIEPGMKKRFQLKDVFPDHHIELKAEQHIEIQNTLEYQSVLQKLKSLNIVQGFDFTAMTEAAKATKLGDFVIARGMKPQQGKNGWVELTVNLDSKQAGPKLREDGTVDFREVNNIRSVHPGQVIAIVHSPIPGVPGVTVTNEPIPPKPVHPVAVHLGKGVTAIENGTKIVALASGRPVFRQQGLDVHIFIADKLIHQGDVDLSSGNIRFHGDVDITGSVEDGMSVETGGTITVFQHVNRATITSKQAIFIRQNVIGSVISAGAGHILVSELVHLLSTIEGGIKKMISSVKQLVSSPAFKRTDWKQNSLFPLIKLLMDYKFRPLAAEVKKYIEAAKTSNRQQLESVWSDLAERFQLCFFSNMPNELHSLEQLAKLLEDIKAITKQYADINDGDSYIEMAYALNSTVYCSGDITVFGQGCYNCTIHSDGFLDIKGIMRGGRAYARKGACIQEAGSDSGVVTRIVVPHGHTVKFGVVKEGTIVQIGETAYTFRKEHRQIEAVLDESGQIILDEKR